MQCSVPDKPEVSITNACSVVLSGKGGMINVVNKQVLMLCSQNDNKQSYVLLQW